MAPKIASNSLKARCYSRIASMGPHNTEEINHFEIGGSSKREFEKQSTQPSGNPQSFGKPEFVPSRSLKFNDSKVCMENLWTS